MEHGRILGLFLFAAGTAVVGCKDDASERRGAIDDRDAGACPLDLPEPPVDVVSRSGADPGELTYQQNGGFSDLYEAADGTECSQGTYDKVDYCHNVGSPDRPSLLRRLGRTLLEPDDGVATVFESANSATPSHRPEPGQTQEMPAWRSSVDGRLLIKPPFQGSIRVHAFRPGNVGHDFQALPTSGNYPQESSRAYGAVSRAAGLIPRLAYLNPHDTDLDFELSGAGQISAMHTTLCEDSPLETSSTKSRTPFPCRARYGELTYSGQQSPVKSDDVEREGLCYQTSVIGGVQEIDTQWELRSAPFTVFVEGALRDDAGSGVIWVYPQDPGGAVSEADPGDVVDLPDFADYDLLTWIPYGATVDDPYDVGVTDTLTWSKGSESQTIENRCYDDEMAPAVGAPAWCDYLYNQRRADVLRFDTNLDATVDRPANRTWDGTSGENSNLFEITTTGDGRLLVINENNGMFYSATEGDPCDASGFTDFIPLSSMPIDPRMSDYPIAQTGGKPFRDSFGDPIPFGSILATGYAWIDRAGSNMLLAVSGEQRDVIKMSGHELVWEDEANAPDTEPDRDDYDRLGLDFGEPGSGHHVAALGAWTRHKMVVLDNGTNPSDFGGNGGSESEDGRNYRFYPRFNVPLYSDSSLSFTPKAVTQVQSFEHMFGAYEAMRPLMPFDVVWSVSSNNGHNSEVAFDEYMHPDAHIVAHMNAAIRVVEDVRNDFGAAALSVEDGFTSDNPFADFPGYHFQDAPDHQGVGMRAMLQNAAGDSTVNALRVRGGARIEPVSLGGVLGRGLWLDGDNDFVDAGYPRRDAHDWYTGVWIDARESGEGPVRKVFHFADGSFIGYRWSGTSMMAVIRDGAGTVTEVELPSYVETGSFFHLAARLTGTAQDREVQLIVDGNPLDVVEGKGGLDVMAGDQPWTWMILGSPSGEVDTPRAWLDEWRVYEIEPSEAWFNEFQCNLALGTLIDSAVAQTRERGEYARARITALHELGFDNEEVCEQLVIRSHDRPTDFAPQHGHRICADRVHQGASDDLACRRSRYVEQPTLTAEDPRPDSHRPFCDSCHEAGTLVEGLSPEALDAGTGSRFEDVRRQPMDPPPLQMLPPTTCEDTDSINENWLAAWAITRDPQADGTYSTDHVIDMDVLSGLGAPTRYIPPSYPSVATCEDQVQNGDELGIDCGGPDCGECCACEDGDRRAVATYCSDEGVVTEFEECSSCGWRAVEEIEECDPGTMCDPDSLSCHPCDPTDPTCPPV